MATVKDLSDQDIAIIKARIGQGEKYAEIASDYRLNQGRIADLKFGRIRPDIAPAQLSNKEETSATALGSKSQMSLL
jgi:hypothetical protein